MTLDNKRVNRFIVCFTFAAFFCSVCGITAYGRAHNLDDALNGLKEKNALERSRAADQAVTLDRHNGGRAVAAALRTEKNREARLRMINALGSAGGREAETELQRHIASEDAEIRLQCAGSLARLGNSEGLGELRAVALDVTERRERRSFAVRCLGNRRLGGAEDVLAGVLDDDDFAIRLQAVASLGAIGTPRALGLVGRMRGDADERVRELAENVLKGTHVR